MHSFVFNHIVEGSEPLVDKVLAEKIVSVAKALPGYKDWCRHRHEIGDRAKEWAACVVAVQDLLSRDALPQRATARFKALLGYGIGGASFVSLS